MSAFDLANWLSLFIALTVALFWPRQLHSWQRLLVFVIFLVLLPFLFVAPSGIVINLFTLLLFMIAPLGPMSITFTRRLQGYSVSRVCGAFLLILFFTPIILGKVEGWLILLSVATQYWFLFSTAVLYGLYGNNYRLKLLLVVSALAGGLIWNFKISLVLFLLMTIHFILTTQSLKHSLRLIAGISALSAFAYVALSDKLLVFLERSVLRPDYDFDTKIGGVSDGGRVNIWTHYFDNSVWLGKGGYYLSDVIPSHNIFVHLVHELGILGLISVGPLFLFGFVVTAKRLGIIFSALLFMTLSLSSVGEYPSMWVYCLVIAPLLMTSSLFIKPRAVSGR